MEPWPDLITDDARRVRIEGEDARHGVDRVEVVTEPPHLNQRVLEVHFLPKSTNAGRSDLASLLKAIAGTPGAVRIHGGVREIGISVQRVQAQADRLRVEVDRPGDFSTYELRVERERLPDADRDRLDPAFSRAAFSFKAGCPSPLDCKTPARLRAGELPDVPIDYMAKDFASIRQALLDRASTFLPGWTDRHEADLTVTLIELLSYVGDQLSYYQDAVANEAWLQTARQRISVRRHARLLDYRMHDGVSARVFVQFQAATAGKVPARTSVLTRIERPIRPDWRADEVELTEEESSLPLREAQAVFETWDDCRVDPAANRIKFHTWGAEEAMLPEGATSADLRTERADLVRPGDFLLLEETAGVAGEEATVDRSHRQVVRVVAVDSVNDPLLGVSVSRVRWHEEDALTFPLTVCLDEDGEVRETAIARGNVALASHGRTVEVFIGRAESSEDDRRAIRIPLPVGPLSFPAVDVTSDGELPSAAALQRVDPRRTRPAIDDVASRDLTAAEARIITSPEWEEVTSEDVTKDGEGTEWEEWSLPDQPSDVDPLDLQPLDLFDSESFENHFVPETDNDGRPILRFGDGTDAARGPEAGIVRARLRVGVGAVGNIGRETIGHVVVPDDAAPWPGIGAVWNPLPAWGGVDPEPLEEVKRLAPHAFQSQPLRAVTEDDYARAAELHPSVSKATARFRWTGSWPTVFLSVDPHGSERLSDEVSRSVQQWVSRFALAGYEVVVQSPEYVPLHVEVEVCVSPSHFRAHVEARVRDALSSEDLGRGRRGFFHPDDWTFGQPVVLSKLYAALVDIDGVDSAEIRILQPLGRPQDSALPTGQLRMSGTQIALLSSDRTHPSPGRLHLRMRGGR